MIVLIRLVVLVIVELPLVAHDVVRSWLKSGTTLGLSLVTAKRTCKSAIRTGLTLNFGGPGQFMVLTAGAASPHTVPYRAKRHVLQDSPADIGTNLVLVQCAGILVAPPHRVPVVEVLLTTRAREPFMKFFFDQLDSDVVLSDTVT